MKGTLLIAEHRERNIEEQNFISHPDNQFALIGEDDNLIYQLTDELPETILAAYDLENGFFANYAEDGEYKEVK